MPYRCVQYFQYFKTSNFQWILLILTLKGKGLNAVDNKINAFHELMKSPFLSFRFSLFDQGVKTRSNPVLKINSKKKKPAKCLRVSLRGWQG